MLSDEELQELDELLLADEQGEALALDEAHGFLTALAVAGSEMAPELWLEELLGSAAAASGPDHDRTVQLLLQLHDDVVEALEGGGNFEPLVIEIEEEGEILEAYEGWCFGFLFGLDLLDIDEASLPKGVRELLIPIAQLALLHDDEELDMDDEEYSQWVELLPGAVRGLYRHWHD